MKKTKAIQTVTVPPVLPDPGVDVFIKRKGSNTLEVARLNRYGTDFVTASFAGDARGRPVRVADVERWDFAVPAGDLLC